MNDKTDKNQQFREKAEKKLKELNNSLNHLPKEKTADLKKLVYELQVHQVELEMQNEELARTQSNLEESRRAYKDLYDFAPVGYLTIDKEGIIQQANLTASFQLGKEKLYLKNENLMKLVFPEDRDTFYLYLRGIFRTGKVQDIEIKFKGKNNCEFYGLVTGKITKESKDNKPLCNIAVTDITEKKVAEKELQESTSQLKQAHHLGLIGNWWYDLSNNQVTWSEMTYKIFKRDIGLGPPSMNTLVKYIYPDDRDLFKSKINEATKNNECKINFRVLSPGDEEKFVDLYCKPIVNSKGEVTKLHGTVQDVTHKVLSEKLRESNATKDKFFSIIGHDLKGPLANIFSLSQLLSSDVREKNYDNLEKLSQFIEKSTRQAVNLINNLLEWARTQTGRMEYKPEKILVQEMVNNVTGLMESLARIKGIRIEYDFPEDLEVYADSNMLHTILRNLLSNAIKYTFPDGEVKLTAEEKDGKVLFSVKDTGIGLKPGQIEKLFRIDTHFSMKGTKKEKGTGLGLIISKEFIEKMGGDIWVESEFKKGSAFYFMVPG